MRRTDDPTSTSRHAHADPVRVVIVDDHNVVRSALRMLLEAHDGLKVVGEASSGEGALRVLDELFAGPRVGWPDVVVMDVMMEGIGGIEAIRRIKKIWPELNVLVLTMADHGAYPEETFRAGASGYVSKHAVDVELIDAIRAVSDGGRYLDPAVGAELIRTAQQSSRGPVTAHGVSLSEREVDVLRLVALGYSNNEIASELNISVRTVEAHKTHLMQKTRLHARSELTRFAYAAGVLTESA